MIFPDRIFIYQKDNKDSAPWTIEINKAVIPAGIKVGVYDFKKKIIMIVTITDEDIIDVIP